MTWNIHLGIGRDGAFSPERVAAVLHELQADVIALQEMPLGPAPFDMLHHLSGATGLHALAGPTLVSPRHGAYGNGLLTRLPVRHWRRLDLSVAHRQPRCAIDASLGLVGSTGLRVIATHLGLRPAERRLQVLQLLRAMDESGGRVTPTVLLGDINEWFLWGRPLRWLHAHFRETPTLPTFPSGRPVFALDRIWVHPARMLERLYVHRSPLARMASDHLPLVADCRLNERKEP